MRRRHRVLLLFLHLTRRQVVKLIAQLCLKSRLTPILCDLFDSAELTMRLRKLLLLLTLPVSKEWLGSSLLQARTLTA